MNKITTYGVLEKNIVNDDLDEHIEEIELLGYTILDPQIPDQILKLISQEFNYFKTEYQKTFTQQGYKLDEIGENDVIRVLPKWSNTFIDLLFNERLHTIIQRILGESYILNQANGIINPANTIKYSQSPYHRDLPFRHLTMSRPIALNALFTLDEFTNENGATHVIPASHKIEKFPSEEVILKNEIQVTAPRGRFIILDCMTYHCGGINSTNFDRRAINHVFTIPAFRQQLHLPSIIGDRTDLSDTQKKILGYDFNEYSSYTQWFDERTQKMKKNS